MTQEDDLERLRADLNLPPAHRRRARHDNVRRLVATEAVTDLDGPGAEWAHLIDWQQFWKREHADEQWLAWPIIPAARSVAFYAPAKGGKSAVLLAAIFALVTGRPIFGRTAAEPVGVLYLDYEMGEDDLWDRLTELGYGPDDDLSRLHYAALPSLPPLDTERGADVLLSLVERLDVALVVVDTFGRAVEGDENDADTVRAFYRHTGLLLKAAGKSVVRTDHAGKDIDKGQRGSSAKNDDVDVVWQLKKLEGGSELTRTHSRISWVPKAIKLARLEHDNGLIEWRIDEKDTIYPQGTKDAAEAMDALDLPLAISVRKAAKALRESGRTVRNDVAAAAVRWRQQVAESRFGARHGNGEHLGEHSKSAPPGTNGGARGTVNETPAQGYGNTSGNTGEHLPPQMGNVPPLLEGNGPSGPSHVDDEGEELF